MKGSGLEDVFAEVYASNSIEQMLLGKSEARAVRAHIMTESALMALLIEVVQDNHDIDINFLEAYYRKALDQQLDDSSILDMTTSDDYVRLQSLIDRTKMVQK